jgi:tRNA modification GTPase
MADRKQTIAAVATPPGSGGIGIVRLSGQESLEIARKIVNIPIKPRYAHYCDFKDCADRNIDRGILLYFNKPHSYTGEDVIEFQCHGGQAVLGLIMKETLAHGARLARPGEFTERAYLNGRIDLVQAEAIVDLINAASEQAARSAVRSLEGDFSRQINTILEQLIDARVFVESSLDFPEEEIEFIEGFGLKKKIRNLLDTLDGLLIRSRKGRLLQRGLRVVIVGEPNTGKSSLLNQLTQSDRAIVTPVAGTTRDTIEDTINANGAFINLVDTAGIRDTHDIVEQEGVRRSLAEAAKADVIIWMTECQDDERDPQRLLSGNTANTMIIVHNKIDLYNKLAAIATNDGIHHIYLSAKTGEGIDYLRNLLQELAGQQDAAEDVILARERHIKALEAARESMEKGLCQYEKDNSTELLAEDLSRAQQALAEITGTYHADDLLGEIFTNFCIGK